MERYHTSKKHLLEHTDTLKSALFSGCMFCGTRPKTYKCCSKEAGEDGCVEKWACCGKTVNSEGCQTRYICCQMDVGN